MENVAGDEAEQVVVWVSFTVSGQSIKTEITLPKQAVRPSQVVPLFSWFANVVVDSAVQADQAEGRQPSCKVGCMACCLQLIPLSEAEAFHLARVLMELSEDRCRVVQARFEEGRKQLERAGLLEQVRQFAHLEEQDIVPLGLDYLSQGIPCPFLENGSCSIYEARPISCREFLVTSPAEHCANPTASTVRRVPLGASVSKAVKSLAGKPEGAMLPWVPLILADEWAEKHTEDSEYLAPELLQVFLERLKDQ